MSTGAFEAIQDYQDAGLADDSQANLLRRTFTNERAVSALRQAIAERRPLTLEEFEDAANPDEPIDDRYRYGILFGKPDGRLNSFSIPNGQARIDALMSEAVARGSKITDAEIERLYANVPAGTDRLY